MVEHGKHGEWKAWTASHPWKKLRTNITQEGKLYFSGSMDVYRFTDEWRMNLGNVNDFQPAIGGPTTRHCSGSSVRDPKKKRLAEGEGGLACENAWTFGWIVVETHGNFPALFFFPRDTVWNMDENSQFETWPFDGKWQIFWRHFLKAGLINTLLLPRIAVPVPGVKPSDFVWREMLDLFFGAKLIVFNESVFALMCTKWVEPTNSSTEGADKARNSGGWCQGGF